MANEIRSFEPVFEEDYICSTGFFAQGRAISLFLNEIGCSSDNGRIDFEGLMSHILKCLGLFLKLRRRSESYRISSAEASVFLGSVKDICEEGIATVERKCFETTQLSAGIDLATHEFKYSTADGDSEESQEDGESRSTANFPVWQPLYWAAMNPRWSAAGELKSLIALMQQSPNKAKRPSCDGSLLPPLAVSLPLTKETLLHFAAKAKHDNTEALRLLSRQAPRAAFTQDVDGNLPLHAAAQYTESVDNLHCLLQLNPEAIHSLNDRGRTPIHVLAARITRLQLPLLECLLNAAKPEDLMIQDKDGNTPLHLAWYEWSMKDAIVARRIFDTNPKAALVTNEYEELSIHAIVEDTSHGPETTSTMDEIESLVEAMISHFNTTSDPGADDYPLLKVDNDCGLTPLQLSCSSNIFSVSWELVSVILRGCPRAASILDDADDYFPLHRYLEFRTVAPFNTKKCTRMKITALTDTIRMLLEAHPPAARVPNIYGMYPLHLATKRWPLEVVQMIYDAYPDAVRLVDGDGAFPLHHAALKPNGSKMIRFLFEKHHEAALLPPSWSLTAGEGAGTTPLHYATDTPGYNLEAIKTLCELEPAALKVRDSAGLTPLFKFLSHISAFNGPRGFDIQYLPQLLFLLNACPEAAAIPDNDNITPFQFAREKGTSVYIQRALLRAAPEVDMAAFCELNYQARRGALYLLFSAVPTEANDMLLWLKLRENADATLIQHVVSYL